MTDQDTSTETSGEPHADTQPVKTAPAKTDPPAEQSAGPDPVRKWILATASLIVALLAWYLAADRFTPFTSQARIDAYVIPIAPQVTGNVLKVSVENNQLVRENDELLVMDSTNYRLAVEQAKADVAAAEQQLAASEAAIVSAAAGLSAARANYTRSEKDAVRLRRIVEEDPGAISVRRVDIAEASLAAADAQVSAAHANVKSARQQSGREEAGVVAARAALEQAEVDLDRTRVLAPGGGLVTDLQVDAGNLAQAGQPLMTFVGINDVWVQADFRENNLGHIEAGDSVSIVLDVQPGRVYRGEVRSIGFGVSTGQNPALGQLPTIENDRNWLRDAQRFPVIIEMNREDVTESLGLRVGGQATVMVFTGNSFLLKPFGRLYMRLVALFSYAY